MGGENEQLIIVKIDATSLRDFQSRYKRWPDKGDLYKPVPEVFEISKTRRRAK